ncbi:MAG TPA: alpha/beta hydrolase [Hyphomicrobiales bacterium]|nr:alpha/beta hydrolase [Hyphomicrobiales bacterium]
MATADGFADRWFKSADGLTLHARDYGAEGTSGRLPVVCLPGLARTAADFHDLALHLAPERRVVVVESRGRGRSERDPDWRHYDIPHELADLLAGLAALGIARAIFVGTSRGGLLTMALATQRPGTIAGAVLNDIGPVIELDGLKRIASYVGKLATPADWTAAAAALKASGSDHFPALSDADWRALAGAMWREEDGRLVLDYDPAIGNTLSAVDLTTAMPPAWPLFDALPQVPLLVLRGERSDILSAATAAAMASRRPAATVLEVPGQGHAPLLRGALLAPLAEFIRRCDPPPA